MRVVLAGFAFALLVYPQAMNHQNRWAIVLHGGAGVIERKSMDAKTEAEYRAGLREALLAGSGVLGRGGSAVDAVEASIRLLEDNPLFNAGRGAVFTSAGRNELDAAVMDGATLKAGAVAGVTRTRHPISLARAVMERSKYVMLIGEGADHFAAQMGLEQVDPSFFFTERRWQGLVKELEKEGKPIPQPPAGVRMEDFPAPAHIEPEGQHKYGTVGVAAVDQRGNVAAGTSTGGTQGKLPGRVGDSPIIGAGTYASNHSCAVSATGSGEYFIRLTVAREICALVEDKGFSVQAAADNVIQKQLTALEGDGGVIVISPSGQMAWSFNTSGMYRARLTEGGQPQISIYKDEP